MEAILFGIALAILSVYIYVHLNALLIAAIKAAQGSGEKLTIEKSTVLQIGGISVGFLFSLVRFVKAVWGLVDD